MDSGGKVIVIVQVPIDSTKLIVTQSQIKSVDHRTTKWKECEKGACEKKELTGVEGNKGRRWGEKECITYIHTNIHTYIHVWNYTNYYKMSKIISATHQVWAAWNCLPRKETELKVTLLSASLGSQHWEQGSALSGVCWHLLDTLTQN